ncbi:MAG: hypothetical protein AB7H86_20160 [Blastocatellales bacterium]
MQRGFIENSGKNKPQVVSVDNNSELRKIRGGSSPDSGHLRKLSGNEQARNHLILSVMLCGIFFIYIATFRAGHDWGDDFAMYIMHSRNIVNGVSYGDTGFILNPMRVVGPQTYPPIFPLLLAPVYYFMGLDLTAMKMLIVLMFLATLAMAFICFRDGLPAKHRLVMIGLIGLNPLFWSFKDHIVSDIPFAFFVFLSLCVIHTSYRKKERWPREILFGMIIALTIYLAYGTRSVGLVLIPCLVAYDLLRNRRPSLKGVTGVAFALAAIYVQNATSHNDGGYGPQIAIKTKHVISHAWIYLKILTYYLENGYSKILKLAIFGLVSCLALVGYFYRLRKEITCFEIFPALYLIPFLVLPILPIERYIAVLVPIYFFYALVGLRAIPAKSEMARYALPAFVIVVLGTYALRYTTIEYGPFRDGVEAPGSIEMFDYVRKNTRPDDVFLFRKPRALALYTNRHSSSWDPGISDEEQWEYIKKIDATYLVLGLEGLDHEDYVYLKGFINRNEERLERRFDNKEFSVYRIMPKKEHIRTSAN